MTQGRGILWWLGTLVCAALAGCDKNIDPGPVARGEPPSFAQVADRYNKRVERLDRFWSFAVVRFRSVDSDGKEIDEQGDGYIQVVRPRKLFLTVGKVGEVGYQLGSNDTEYWWIDVRNQTAQVGEHAKFTPETGRRAGLPVHPLDVLEVLGIMPIETAADGGSVEWSADGRLLVVGTATQFGRRVLVIDPATYEPREVRLLDSAGETVVNAVLSDSKPIPMPDPTAPPARSPTTFEITVPGTKTFIKLWAQSPENRGSRMKDQAFDLGTLLRQFKVASVTRIDQGAAASAVGE